MAINTANVFVLMLLFPPQFELTQGAAWCDGRTTRFQYSSEVLSQKPLRYAREIEDDPK
jgi:hypothetical protein